MRNLIILIQANQRLINKIHNRKAMNNKTNKQKIGKANYDSNLSINQEIQLTMSEYHLIFKEKMMQFLENFFVINIKEKLDQRHLLIKNMREKFLKYDEYIKDNIKPYCILSENSLNLIRILYDNFFNLKTFSDRIKNEVNFKNYETNFKIIFQQVFDLMDQIQEILNYYIKVFRNFNFDEHRKFYEKITYLFTDLEMHFTLIPAVNHL